MNEEKKVRDGVRVRWSQINGTAVRYGRCFFFVFVSDGDTDAGFAAAAQPLLCFPPPDRAKASSRYIFSRIPSNCG